MKRRGRGEGSIYQRADGRWCGEIFTGWQDGQRTKKSVYGRTRREVHEKLQAAQRAIGSGLRPADDRLTVATYLADWLEKVRPPRGDIRPSTFRSYESITRIHIVPAIGRIPLVKLRVDDVESALRAKSTSDLSPRSVAMIRGTLRTALNRAVKQRLIRDNVAALADGPKQERHEIHPLDVDQARVLLDAIDGHRLEALFVTALTTGLRSGELRALRWENIDFESGALRVDAGLAKIDGRWQRVPPKSSSGRRAVPLLPKTVTALREHRIRQDSERRAAGSEWIGNEWDLVFVSEVGTPLDSANVLHQYQRAVTGAGLPHQRLHDARHGVATLWIAAGVSMRVVADLLGHSTTSLTMNTYAHVLPTAHRDAADRLAGILEAPPREEAVRSYPVS